MTCTAASQDLARICLPRLGLAPYVFSGALLVKADGRADNSHVRCTLAVYEAQDGFVGHVALSSKNDETTHNLVHVCADPEALRLWITQVNPALAILPKPVPNAVSCDDPASLRLLSEAAQDLTSQMRDLKSAYQAMLETAFGGADHDTSQP